MRRLSLLLLGGLLLLVLASCDLLNPDGDDPLPYTGGTVSEVTFELLGPTEVRLNWAENFPDEDGFYVDRKLWDGAWERKIQSVAANATTVVDTTAQLGKVYYYKVYAFKGEQESVEEQQQYNCYLPAPADLDYDYSWSQPNRVRLFWLNKAAWADSIVVAKRLSGEQWTAHLAALPGSATEWTDLGYNHSQTVTWGFTAYFQDQVSQQATLTLMPPK
ncbi:MAG TPA: hypothetical protein PLQ80_05000 [Candidatus Syntrophosphaera sp.]|nr:hypothetical protein [Candidatus Syntrophosphaera sp.]HPH61531.1 hypothetical protein [Candidatus Syntrophosphaera sp.]